MTSSLDATSTHHGGARPPPLPPRPSSGTYSARPDDSLLTAMTSKDPRSSSQQSLVPDPALENSGRRRLLLVYIHGFMGNETSFRSFPAHVHNLATITLADSHVVHTKIYPRYRSRHALEVARDDFSSWLTPHEDRWTDVILLGHSMGGLLAADIALLLRHHIIGVINFDVPFVGMHPGIVKAGLGSIFKPWPTPEEPTFDQSSPGTRPSRMSTLFNPKPLDPNYNPSFHNDSHLPVRKGWSNTLHFINKHSNGLIEASKGLVKSHIEFGGAMADYRQLKDRYARVRALEEDDERIRKSANPNARSPPRIRFVNYYTVSTGRPKKPKSPRSPRSPSPSRPAHGELEHARSDGNALASGSPLTLQTSVTEPGTSPRISVQEQRGNELVPVSPQEPLSATSPAAEDPRQRVPVTEVTSQAASATEAPPSLPEIPPIPQEPPFVDLAQYPDKAERKAAEKEHDRALKDYQRAVKARNKVIKERTKIEERWEKQKRKENASSSKEAKADSSSIRGDNEDNNPNREDKVISSPGLNKVDEDLGAMQLGVESPRGKQNNSPYGNYDFSRSAILNQADPADQASITDSSLSLSTQDINDPDATTLESDSTTPKKKKRLGKFCMLPPKDANGNKDPTWVQVFMEGVDEVTAHTTLFFMSDTYEQLVGDTVTRIEDWITEAESLRVVSEMQGFS